MPEIVHQGQRLGEIDVQSQRASNGTRDLRHLDRMSQTVAKVIGIAAREDLSLVFETPKSSRMDDAVAVALEVVAVGMQRLRETPSAGMLHLHGVAGQHSRSLAGASTQYLVNPCESVLLGTGYSVLTYCFPEPSCARRTLAASSFFCVDANSSPSTSEPTVLFHSWTARSQ